MIHIDKFYLYFKLSSKDKAEVFPLKLVSKELATISHITLCFLLNVEYVGKLIFVNQFLFFIINVKKENANTLTLLISLIVKSLHIFNIHHYIDLKDQNMTPLFAQQTFTSNTHLTTVQWI